MPQIKQLIKISRKWAKSFLKGEEFDPQGTQSPLKEKDRKELYDQLHDASYWEQRNEFLENIDVESEWKSLEAKITTKRRSYSYYKYAAVLISIVGISAFFFFQNSASVSPKAQVVAGTDKAVLTLENGEQVVLEGNTSFKNQHANVEKNTIHYQKNSSSPKSISYNYLTIPRGGQYQVVLSDGTAVWLNSQSQLKYPVHFLPGQTRTVELVYGEAFFEVTHSSEHNGDRFRVLSSGQEVEVLGTMFNIRAYKEEPVYTTLSQGSVAISNSSERHLLAPGEQAVNRPESGIRIASVEVEYEIAWKNGLFMFEQEPLDNMMTTLSRWYDMEVEFVNKEKQHYTFSGILNREDNVLKLLNTLEKTNEVSFEIQEKKILIR